MLPKDHQPRFLGFGGSFAATSDAGAADVTGSGDALAAAGSGTDPFVVSTAFSVSSAVFLARELDVVRVFRVVVLGFVSTGAESFSLSAVDGVSVSASCASPPEVLAVVFVLLELLLLDVDFVVVFLLEERDEELDRLVLDFEVVVFSGASLSDALAVGAVSSASEAAVSGASV